MASPRRLLALILALANVCVSQSTSIPPPPVPRPLLPPSPPLPPSWLSAFTCCTGQASCGGANNDPVQCDALGDLYFGTNGTGWTINAGWRSAAAGTPTDYCSFAQTACDGVGNVLELYEPAARTHATE